MFDESIDQPTGGLKQVFDESIDQPTGGLKQVFDERGALISLQVD